MNKLKIKRLVVGPIEANCYLIVSGNELAVVDPGDEAEKIITEIEKLGNLDYKYILLTHGHFDHVMAVNELKSRFQFQIVISKKDAEISDLNTKMGVSVPEIKPDILLPAEGATLCIGNREIQVLGTPGHSAGSVCYLIGDNLFSGDTLFKCSHGRTDLPGGSSEEIKKSLKKLFELDLKIKVYPGHGPETTIEEEINLFKNHLI